MKKIALFLVVAMVAIAITACGPKEEGVLTIFQNKVEIHDQLTTYAEGWSEKTGIEVNIKTCGGDACEYGAQILAEFQSEEQPDIFVIEGMGGYNEFKYNILDLTGEAWIDDTGLEFIVEDKVFGFPVAIEGWGMAYNEDLLKQVGFTDADIEALKDVSQVEFEAAFQRVQDFFDNNSGFENHAVVSMAAGPGMHWVTGLHNFNGFLTAGLDYGDSSILDNLNNGVIDSARLNEYVNWVDMLFKFADQDILLTGGYDDQVGKFAEGRAAFLHQGNWTDSSFADSDFEMAYLPHAAMETGNDSIFIGAPSYYVVNINSDMIDAAKLFLNDLASTTEGHEYMVNEANMVPAFDSVTLVPTTPLSASVLEWNQAGNAYAWRQNDMPSGFGFDILGPIFELYAAGNLTRAAFIEQIKAEVALLA